jgi:uncharacterized membrane-anchored protein
MTSSAPGEHYAMPDTTQDVTALQVLREHPDRGLLVAELHARPFESFTAPLRASHLAMLGSSASADRAHVAALCHAMEQRAPREQATHHSVELGGFRLRWERHTEFSTYTFFITDHTTHDAMPFSSVALNSVPEPWLAGIPGELVAGVHLSLEAASRPLRSVHEVVELFRTPNVAGSMVADGGALVVTDFRLHGDGLGRILVQDRGLPAMRTGRLVQRLLEIETYRLMALLAFPLARGAGGELYALEKRLQQMTERMTHDSALEDQQALLGEISALAGELARAAAARNFRLSAARAYHSIVRHRIQNLRESRLSGLQTIGEFMDRRFTPAMQTCDSIVERQETLSRSLSRAADLLRTRVDVALEAQNRDLLASMNRRTDLQLRLQQTVEGLSVVVISYYSAGLLLFMLRSLVAAGMALNVDLLMGISVPFLVVGIWLGIRAMRRRLLSQPPTQG